MRNYSIFGLIVVLDFSTKNNSGDFHVLRLITCLKVFFDVTQKMSRRHDVINRWTFEGVQKSKFRMHSDWKYFHRKKLDGPAQLGINTGRYCDKKFHGLSDSQKIVYRIKTQFRIQARQEFVLALLSRFYLYDNNEEHT